MLSNMKSWTVFLAGAGLAAGTFTPTTSPNLIVLFGQTEVVAGVQGATVDPAVAAQPPSSLACQSQLTGTSFTVILVNLDATSVSGAAGTPYLQWMQTGLTPAAQSATMESINAGTLQGFPLQSSPNTTTLAEYIAPQAPQVQAVEGQGVDTKAAEAPPTKDKPAEVKAARVVRRGEGKGKQAKTDEVKAAAANEAAATVAVTSQRYMEVLVDTTTLTLTGQESLKAAAQTRDNFDIAVVLINAGLSTNNAVCWNWFNVTAGQAATPPPPVPSSPSIAPAVAPPVPSASGMAPPMPPAPAVAHPMPPAPAMAPPMPSSPPAEHPAPAVAPPSQNPVPAIVIIAPGGQSAPVPAVAPTSNSSASSSSSGSGVSVVSPPPAAPFANVTTNSTASGTATPPTEAAPALRPSYSGSVSSGNLTAVSGSNSTRGITTVSAAPRRSGEGAAVSLLMGMIGVLVLLG